MISILIPLAYAVLSGIADPAPAFAPGTRVLFQGDSITDGNRGRSSDPNHILGHGYAFLIAAKYGAMLPERKLVFLNHGISGDTVASLAARWQADTLDRKPDILSILVGVNDSLRRTPAEEFEKTYDKLLADTVAANPKVRLVLCEPFTLPVGRYKENWEEWCADVRRRQAIVARLAVKYRATLVRLQKVFDDACRRAPAEHWIWDGIHPTYSGHQLLADEWERAVLAGRPAVHVVVAADGSGDFRTITSALGHGPVTTGSERLIIEVKPGIYSERVMIPPDRPRVTLRGTDPANTIIRYGMSSKAAGSTSFSATVEVNGAEFEAENITFENSFGQGSQAVALLNHSDRSVLRNCRFTGWQDTLYAASGRQYYRDCYIEGHVDFIFGNAAAVFENCRIHSRGAGFITAQSRRLPDGPTGFVFDHCRLTGENTGDGVYLGRPWRTYSRVVYLDCFLGGHIRPAGWDNWGNPENEKTAWYGEFGSTGPGAQAGGRVKWARQLTADEAARFRPDVFLRGEDLWNPQPRDTRARAWDAVRTAVREDKYLRHSQAVEGILREMAAAKGDDRDEWGLAGLVHDIDIAATVGTTRHGVEGSRMLRDLGLSPAVVHAVNAHDDRAGVARTSRLDHALYCADQVYWLFAAAGAGTAQERWQRVRAMPAKAPAIEQTSKECGEIGLSVEQAFQVAETAAASER